MSQFTHINTHPGWLRTLNTKRVDINNWKALGAARPWRSLCLLDDRGNAEDDMRPKELARNVKTL
jgi:hypothetical protein